MTPRTHTRKMTKHTRWTTRVSAAAILTLVPLANAFGATFQGTGLTGGINHAQGLQGISQSTNIRQTAINILIAILNFLALAAVAVVIIAGFFLVFSMGNDDQKDKAKKTIYYTLIGLAVILFARVIVGLITEFLASQV